MKSTARLFSPAAALARVFLPSASPRPPTISTSSSCQRSTSSSLLVVPQFLIPRGRCQSNVALSSPSACCTQRRCLHQRPPSRRPPAASAGARKPNPAFRSQPLSPRPIGDNSSGGSAVIKKRSPGGGGGGSGKGVTHVKYKLGRMPRDGEITHRHVILRQEDGSLSDPQPTNAVLAGLNRRTQSLVVLALPPDERKTDSADDGFESASASPEEGPAQNRRNAAPRFPICKIVDRVAERKAEYDRAKEQRKKTSAGKELEINWAIDAHDLGHRLAKLQEFLERGLRVEVTMLRKSKNRGKRQATRDEAVEVVRRVRETVAAVPGARETRNMEGELLRTAKLFLEGSTKDGE